MSPPGVGSHVVLAACQARHGVTARALAHLGVAPEALEAGARRVLAAAH